MSTSKFSAVSRDAERTARDVAENVQHGAEVIADKASDALHKASAYASDAMTTVSDQASIAADKAKDVASDVQRTVARSVGEYPVTTLAAVAAVAFTLGALWKMQTPAKQPAWWDVDRLRRW
ncbi:MAG: hypothetical protein ACRCTD_12570 [Beijerinckiaceae bacterium]